jgi:hypothetical protein
MSSNLTESLSSTQRRQVLPSLLDIPDEERAATDQNGSAISSDEEHQTLYIAFEAPNEMIVPAEAVDGSGSAELSELVASQALELAANRAEIARYQREQEDLQRGLRLRETWLQELQAELKTAQEERQVLSLEVTEARATLERMERRLAQQAAQIKALESDAAERMGKTLLPAERARPLAPAPAEVLNLANPATLQPLDGDAEPIVLNRKVMTVGRTRDNHVFVPSQLVSRDHARVLVGEEGVVVFDVGSANGCFVNDHQVKRQLLRDGDIVRFGDRRFKFSV